MHKVGMDKEATQVLLPEVGDKLMRTPNVHKAWGVENPYPRPCVVEEVHKEHLWYRVRYPDTGFTECYKVPDLFEKGVRLK